MDFAVLLQACLAARAHPAGIHETADCGKLTCFEALHLGSDACHASDNFVAGDHGINRAAPLVSCLMDVRVADSTVENLDEHIMGPRFTPLKVERFENRRRTFGYVSTCR